MSAIDLPVTEMILATIAQATPKRPANVGDVVALVGAAEADVWRALELLQQQGRIGAPCLISRPGAPSWWGIFPTGRALRTTRPIGVGLYRTHLVTGRLG